MDPFTKKIWSYGLYIEYVGEYDRYNETAERLIEQMEFEGEPEYVLEQLFEYHISLGIKDPEQFKDAFKLPEIYRKYSDFAFKILKIELYPESETFSFELSYTEDGIAQGIFNYQQTNPREFTHVFKEYRVKKIFDPEGAIWSEVDNYKNKIKTLDEDRTLLPFKNRLYLDLLDTIEETKVYYREQKKSII